MRFRRVLHFVDEDVANLVVEQQRHVAGFLGAAERFLGTDGDVDMIGDAVGDTDPAQFRGRDRQESEQRDQHGPLLVVVTGRRQFANAMQQLHEVVATVECRNQVGQRLLALLVVGQETVSLVDALAECTIVLEQRAGDL